MNAIRKYWARLWFVFAASTAWGLRDIQSLSGLFLGWGIGFLVWDVVFIKRPHLFVASKTFSPGVWSVIALMSLVSSMISGAVLFSTFALGSFSVSLFASLGAIVLLSVGQWAMKMQLEAQAGKKK